MSICPICQTEYIENQDRVCVTCGFDLTPYPLSLNSLPEVYLEKERTKLVWGRELWQQLLRKSNLSQAEYDNLLQTQKDLQSRFDKINVEKQNLLDQNANLQAELEQRLVDYDRARDNLEQPTRKPQLPSIQFSITPDWTQRLAASSTDEKFMLKLRPTKDLAASLSSTTFVFLIDTSGSMYEVVSGNPEATGEQVLINGTLLNLVIGGKTKIDIVMESLHKLVSSGRFHPNDRIAIVQFDDTASTIIGLTPVTQVNKLKTAIDHLSDFSGGTSMSLGLEQALNILSDQTMTNCRVLIFTDGYTSDTFECEEIAKKFSQLGIPITALGIGDYDEDLLISLTDTTGGVPYHVVSSNHTGTQVLINELPSRLIEEFGEAQDEVITNLKMTLSTVQGVKLSRITRVYPINNEFLVTQNPYALGNLKRDDDTVFILEFSIEPRLPARVRIAKLSLTYHIPSQNRCSEVVPQNLFVDFFAGKISDSFDPEFSGYMWQSDIYQLVYQATKVANQNLEKATEALEKIRRITVPLLR